MSMSDLLSRAYVAASAAILAHFQAGNREKPFNCGYAWVTIPGTSALAKWCRRDQSDDNDSWFGAKGYPKGWTFFCPGQWPTHTRLGFTVYQQDLDFHLAGARAFAAVLRENGIEAVVDARLD